MENVLAVAIAFWILGALWLVAYVSSWGAIGVKNYFGRLSFVGGIGTACIMFLFLPSIVVYGIVYSVIYIISSISNNWYVEQ